MNKTIAPPRRRDSSRNEKSFEIDEVATDLILKHGATILQDARRYSACLADAEDAYQQSVVIMLTKAPSTDPAELVPWLRVVVRRQATAIARSRNRLSWLPLRHHAEECQDEDSLPEEIAADALDAAMGAEALSRLSKDQVRCLLAQAEGNTYAEIEAMTGFSARKVSRCVNDGRRAFIKRVAAIEAGSECERVNGLLEQLVAGDDAAFAIARPHLKHCRACQASLREYTEAPNQARVLFPPALIAVAASSDVTDSSLNMITVGWNSIVDKVLSSSYSAQHWMELSFVKKAGAVVAVTAAVAAGGAVLEGSRPSGESGRDVSSVVEHTTRIAPTSIRKILPIEPAPARPATQLTLKREQRNNSSTRGAAKPVTSPQSKPTKNESVGDGSSEFLPEAR